MPTKHGKSTWPYTTLNRIVRHPLLAGMIPHNPGNTTSHIRGEEVLRDDDGLPVVDESLAVMSVSRWRAMQAKLDAPTRPQRRSYALRGRTSGLLSGLVWCGEHPEPIKMWRGTVGPRGKGRPAYTCRRCHQTISNLDPLVIEEFLAVGGDELRLTKVEEVVEGGAVQLQEASVRLAELGREVINATPERATTILADMQRLKAIQEEAKAQPAQVRLVPVGDARTYKDDWEAAQDDEARRPILEQALSRVLIRRGKWGDHSVAGRRARVTFEWADGFGTAQPSDVEAATWADDDPASRQN